MRPAAPASIPPIRNVSEIVVLTLIPISRAASGSCAVARIALPWRVRLMNQVSDHARAGSSSPIANTSARRMTTPEILNDRVVLVDQVVDARR